MNPDLVNMRANLKSAAKPASSPNKAATKELAEPLLDDRSRSAPAPSQRPLPTVPASSVGAASSSSAIYINVGSGENVGESLQQAFKADLELPVDNTIGSTP